MLERCAPVELVIASRMGDVKESRYKNELVVGIALT